MDDLHSHLFTVLMDREWKHGVAAAVDVTLLGRFYERFADHAVEVARRVIFQATGKRPDDAGLRASPWPLLLAASGESGWMLHRSSAGCPV